MIKPLPRFTKQDLAEAIESSLKIKCATCTDVPVEGSDYCRSCKDYWDDVDNGLWADDFD